VAFSGAGRLTDRRFPGKPDLVFDFFNLEEVPLRTDELLVLLLFARAFFSKKNFLQGGARY
jgi:hypothetical protein